MEAACWEIVLNITVVCREVCSPLEPCHRGSAFRYRDSYAMLTHVMKTILPVIDRCPLSAAWKQVFN